MIACLIVATNIVKAQTQCITDGGFEAGPGAGTWVEASTNFGTPLCDLATCGTGTGTGPHTGNIWSWFGGFGTGIEQSSLSQSFTIPAGSVSADLTFWIEQIVCDDPQDYMNIIIDNDTVFHTDGASALCGVLGYTQNPVIDMMAYADGLPHTILFESTTFAVNATVTNFFIDDIIVCSGVRKNAPFLTALMKSKYQGIKLPCLKNFYIFETSVLLKQFLHEEIF